MDLDWLEDLKTGNRDDSELEATLREKSLQVNTKLDGLLGADEDEASSLVRGNEGEPVRSLLLLAHAGDGKSHFFGQLEAAATRCDREVIRFDPEKENQLGQRGLHLLNDPSLTAEDEVVRFLEEAFCECSRENGGSSAEQQRASYVIGVNRGKFRELVPKVEGQAARQWLENALQFEDEAHFVDEEGRLAVPLDRRVLVSGPANSQDEFRQAPVWKLASRVFNALNSEIRKSGDVDSVSAQEWADRVSVVLSLVEACGHHVTFREGMALAGAVAEALIDGDSQALSVLFQDGDPVPALSNIVQYLRRMDPARVAVPWEDGEFQIASKRDEVIRRRAIKELVDLFVGRSETVDRPLPFRSGGDFLQLCRDLGETAQSIVEIKRGLKDLPGETVPDSAHSAIKASVGKLEEGAEMENVPDWLFRGLAQFAWGAQRVPGSDEVIPLTSPIQPGTRGGVDGWRVLRSAVSRDQARFQPTTTDFGPYVERGLILPRLKLKGPSGLSDSPTLVLDLELFENLTRIGEGTGANASLGSREGQVNTWLDGTVAEWKERLMEPLDGLVTFETILGEDTNDPVTLRPPTEGPSNVIRDRNRDDDVSVLGTLKSLWPESGSGITDATIAATPAACASALLQWAGMEPQLDEVEEKGRHGALREAIGAGSVRVLRQRTNFVAPAFPWSVCTLNVGVKHAGGKDHLTTFDHGPELGAACANALGLTGNRRMRGDFRSLLRATWAHDEEAFDTHPSSLLAHQWMGAGLKGNQLEECRGRGSEPETPHRANKVLAKLLSQNVPFSAAERWWLVGTWASWWLMLTGLRELHDMRGEGSPVMVPKVGGEGQKYYSAIHERWFGLNESVDSHGEEALQAVGLASGFLTPPTAYTSFDLTMDGGVDDLIRILAWYHCAHDSDAKTEQTVERLQELSLESGLFAQKAGEDIRDRLPRNTLRMAAPVAIEFDEIFRRKLETLGLLNAGSDGASLIRSPWE